MRLGIVLRTTGPTPRLDMDLVLEAERLGFYSAWTSEAWGGDAVSTVSWMLSRTTKIKGGTGIMQMQARTPSCAAMTAMSLQALSDDRFLLGIGPSGPQVIEGWHGVPYGKPLGRTREYVAIVRQIFARERPLEHKGEHYQIPYAGPGATGLGKPLKTIMHPKPTLKIYTASIAPAGLRTAAEVADGVLPFLMSPEKADAIVAPLREGLAAAPGKTFADFDNAPYVRIRMGDDLAACRDALRAHLAFYVGGMGARSKNFYNDLVKRMGYEAEAARIQDLFLDGKRNEAAAAVPDALIDETCLIGPPARIKDRLQAWQELARDHRLGTMLLADANLEAIRVVAEAML
ncbi:MAG TPA: LLM class F420-dependent oxidoreductase [Xanthobacteraceae bacterium]|jgi:F420-dependent oxidoreductase-like protein|nr:LLM class F420-dependent oxidoreductase [Xanthobacteraceae bacterium]